MNDIITFCKDFLPKDFCFHNKQGKILGGERFIFPICGWEDTEKKYFVQLATAFLLSRDGLIITAKHVFEPNNEVSPDTDMEKEKELELYAFAVMSDKHYHKIPIKPHRILSDISDISFGQLYPLKHKKTNNHYLFDNVLKLSSKIPEIGDRVFTYSYPGSGFSIIPQDDRNHYQFTPTVFNGVIKEHHLEGLNSVPPLGPCVSTTMETQDGVSGGPVFSSKSQVIGINSAKGIGSGVSYFTPIRYILEVPFEMNEEGILSEETISQLSKKMWIDLNSEN